MLSQQLVNGLVLGSTYALFALGFTLIFGVLRVINLTYGFYFSIGAFVALTVARQFGANIWVALPVGALSAGVVAVVADWVLLTRLRRAKAGELSSLMVTLGAVLALQVAAVHVPWLQGLFDTTALSLAQWALAAAIASSVLWVEEARKAFTRHRARGNAGEPQEAPQPAPIGQSPRRPR